MKLYKVVFSTIFLTLANTVIASEEAIPEPFRGDDPESKLEITYDDLDTFLKGHVYVMGRSNREKAPKPEATIGTKMRVRINRLTAMEGNRFYFKAFEEEDIKEILTFLRESLEALPSEVPLSYLTRDEQLAYWINLYNFTLLDEIAKIYPQHNLKRVLDYGDEDSILAQKVLNVAGVELSLDDIQYKILKEKYHDNPLIIYGLFQGNIGGPSIRSTAYKGKNVWRQLEANATEFINSNRGTYYDGEISALYERNMGFFKNDMNKLREHLLDYLEDDFYAVIRDEDDLEFETEDWSFAELMGNQRQYGGAYHTNTAALIDSVRTVQSDGTVGTSFQTQNFLAENYSNKAMLGLRFSPDELEMLKRMKAQHEINSGTVEIKDIEETKEKQEKDEQ